MKKQVMLIPLVIIALAAIGFYLQANKPKPVTSVSTDWSSTRLSSGPGIVMNQTTSSDGTVTIQYKTIPAYNGSLFSTKGH